MLRLLILTLIGGALAAASAPAAPFQHVVSLGDSVLDDPDGLRSPVLAEHLPLTKLAVSGSTSTTLLCGGQHTQAAAQFGAGDLAILSIGASDFFFNLFEPDGVVSGNFAFLDVLEANVRTALQTVRAAGLDALALNLPDLAGVPLAFSLTLDDQQFAYVRQAMDAWNARLVVVADDLGVGLIDSRGLFADLVADPDAYALRGNPPVLAPEFGCQFCVFADAIHPGPFAQGYLANETLAALEAFYALTELPRLKHVELAQLAGIAASDFDGDGAVDSADLTAWEAAPWDSELADATADARSDGADLLAWQRAAFDAGAAAQHAVPEPTSVAWLAMIVAAAARRACKTPQNR
jgi:hypothetical protein